MLIVCHKLHPHTGQTRLHRIGSLSNKHPSTRSGGIAVRQSVWSACFPAAPKTQPFIHAFGSDQDATSRGFNNPHPGQPFVRGTLVSLSLSLFGVWLLSVTFVILLLSANIRDTSP